MYFNKYLIRNKNKSSMKKLLFFLVLIFLSQNCFPQKSKIHTYSGKIDDKYEITMVLSQKADNKIVGYYFYEKYNIKIPLEGTVEDNLYVIKEYPDFEFSYKKGFKLESFKNELTGCWFDSLDKKNLGVFLKKTTKSGVKYISKYKKVEGFYQDIVNSRTLFRDVEMFYIADDIFLFCISSVHENGCNGFVKELISLNDDYEGVYKSKDCAEIKITCNSDELIVEEKDCTALHGYRCPFDGKYVKRN